MGWVAKVIDLCQEATQWLVGQNQGLPALWLDNLSGIINFGILCLWWVDGGCFHQNMVVVGWWGTGLWAVEGWDWSGVLVQVSRLELVGYNGDGFSGFGW